MERRDAVRRAYDELAETYAAQRSAGGLDRLERFREALPDDPRVLDAGCGQGTPVLERLAESDASAVGLDFSGEQLRLAREAAPAAALVRGDMTALPFADGAFDGVTAYHSLIHVPLEDHGTAIEEFARVLRPGGLALLSEGHTEWVGSNPDWIDSGVEMRWSIAGAEATREQLRSAGFTVLDEWAVDDELADEEGAQKPFFLARLDE